MGKGIRTWIFASMVAALALVAAPADAATVTVTPQNLGGWSDDSTNPSNVRFVNGPGNPPAGSGSLEFRIAGYGVGEAEIRNSSYNGVRLADIDEMSYSTYVAQNMDQRTVNLILNVDRDNNGSVDDILFFEPRLQSGTSTAAITSGTWQRWRADQGRWWALSYSNGASFRNLMTLDEYSGQFPNAVIRNVSQRQGGIRLAAGFQELGNWSNFVGNVDQVTLNAGGTSNTYNFESLMQATTTNPGGGPQSKDDCKDGGWMRWNFRNQGQCVSWVNNGGNNNNNWNNQWNQYMYGNPWMQQYGWNPYGQYNPYLGYGYGNPWSQGGGSYYGQFGGYNPYFSQASYGGYNPYIWNTGGYGNYYPNNYQGGSYYGPFGMQQASSYDQFGAQQQQQFQQQQSPQQQQQGGMFSGTYSGFFSSAANPWSAFGGGQQQAYQNNAGMSGSLGI